MAVDVPVDALVAVDVPVHPLLAVHAVDARLAVGRRLLLGRAPVHAVGPGRGGGDEGDGGGGGPVPGPAGRGQEQVLGGWREEVYAIERRGAKVGRWGIGRGREMEYDRWGLVAS